MLYILLGEDDYSINESLEEIKKDSGEHSLLAVNTTSLDSQQLTLDQLRAICDTPPFLAEKRLVIIKGLLERSEPRGKPGRQKKIKQATGQQKEPDSLSDYIGNLPDSTVLVLIDGKIKSSNPLFKKLSGGAVVKSFPLLRGSRLSQWIQGRITKEGGTISPPAVELLTSLVGSNLWMMTNEINKLLLFATGRRIEEDDVRMTASHTQQTNVFTLVDAILEFRAKQAEQSLHQLLLAGASPSYLLAMLVRQVRMIARVKELSNQDRPEREIQHKLGLIAEFTWRKTTEQAERYTPDRIKQVYRKLLETDLAIKTGKYEAGLALNILTAELCQRSRV